MKKSNLSVLDLNILHGLQGACIYYPEYYEEAETIYLRFKHLGELKAEELALEWACVGQVLEPMMRAAWRIGKEQGCIVDGDFSEENFQDLRKFIRIRYENWKKRKE